VDNSSTLNLYIFKQKGKKEERGKKARKKKKERNLTLFFSFMPLYCDLARRKKRGRSQY